MNQKQTFQQPVTKSTRFGSGIFQSMSLRNRLLLAFITLAILPVLVTGTIATVVSSQGLRSDVFNELESVTILKENAIKEWLNVLQTNLGIIYEDRTVQQDVSALLQNTPETVLDQDQLRDELISFNDRTGYFVEIFALDADGTVVLSTDELQEGKIQSNQAFFREGLENQHVSPPVYEVSLSSYSIVISEPIRTASGTVIGVLAGRVNLSTLSDIMQQETGLGEAGETYLVSSNFAVLTNIKNIEFTPGETYIRTDGVTNAIQSKVAGTATYTDYAGNDTFGVYHWIPELQIALIAEHNQAEALQASNRVLQVTVGLIIVTALIAVFIAFVVTRGITSPITKLVDVANNIAQGNLGVQAEVLRHDEIGVLAQSFNTMTARLQDLVSSLEQRVADRTKALATSAEISRSLSTILEQKQLVTEVVEQVQTAFNYYHAHIYLLNEAGDELVLAGATGDAGQTLIAHGHKILKGQGLVGRAAETNVPVLVSDTAKSPDWLPNPLLPETKSEVAIPISIGNQALGVLDVQHNITDGLQEEDTNLLLSIANQVAVALQNIRQYENTQKIAADMGVVANVGIATSTITDATLLLQEVVDLAKKSFKLYHAHIYLLNDTGDALELTSGAGEVGRQMVSEKRSISLDSEQSLVARAARTLAGVVVNDVTATPDFLPNPLLPETRSEMAVPMIVAGKVIGVLDVQSETIDRFTDVDVSIQTTLASQVAVALQNARSFSQTQRQVEREIALNLITQKIQSATTIESALQVTARELGHALGMKQTLVMLEPENLNGEHKSHA